MRSLLYMVGIGVFACCIGIGLGHGGNGFLIAAALSYLIHFTVILWVKTEPNLSSPMPEARSMAGRVGEILLGTAFNAFLFTMCSVVVQTLCLLMVIVLYRWIRG